MIDYRNCSRDSGKFAGIQKRLSSAAILKTYDQLQKESRSYDRDLFTDAVVKGKLDVNTMKADKHLFDYVVYDSSNEFKFAQKLDVSSEVAV